MWFFSFLRQSDTAISYKMAPQVYAKKTLSTWSYFIALPVAPVLIAQMRRCYHQGPWTITTEKHFLPTGSSPMFFTIYWFLSLDAAKISTHFSRSLLLPKSKVFLITSIINQGWDDAQRGWTQRHLEHLETLPLHLAQKQSHYSFFLHFSLFLDNVL